MVEVTNCNFNDVLGDFEYTIEKCSFFAVDCEFTALPQTSNIEFRQVISILSGDPKLSIILVTLCYLF